MKLEIALGFVVGINFSHMEVCEPASTSQVQGKRKQDKMVAQQAITLMAEQSMKLTNEMRNFEAAKLTILQGMLSTMNELVRKL